MVKKRRKPLVEEGPPDISAAQLNGVLLTKSAAAPAPSSYNGAKLAIELLETATTQTVQRMGWFRDVRLRRAADAFLRSSKTYQQANARWESETGGYGFEKPSQTQIDAYTDELKQHIDQLQARFRAAPNGNAREINIKSAGPGKVIGKDPQKMKEVKKRATELAKNPNSVIKSKTINKKRRSAAATKRIKNDGNDDCMASE